MVSDAIGDWRYNLHRSSARRHVLLHEPWTGHASLAELTADQPRHNATPTPDCQLGMLSCRVGIDTTTPQPDIESSA